MGLSLSQRIGALVVAAFAVVFTRLPWLVSRLFNPLMRRLLTTPVPVGPNALLTVRGRRSGLPRTVVVTFLDLGQRAFLQAAHGDADWAHNLRAFPEAVIRRGRRSERYEAGELAPEAAGPVLHELLAAFPRSRLVGAVVGPTSRPPVAVLHFFRLRVDETPGEYIALAGRQPLFELRRRDAQPGPTPAAVATEASSRLESTSSTRP